MINEVHHLIFYWLVNNLSKFAINCQQYSVTKSYYNMGSQSFESLIDFLVFLVQKL